MRHRTWILFSLCVLIFWAGNIQAAAAGKVKVTAQVANIRKTADPSGPVLQQVKIGEVLPVIEKTGDWYKVVLPGGEGYIHTSVVEFIADSAKQNEPAPALKPAQTKPAAPLAASVQESAAPGKKMYVRLSYQLGFISETQTLAYHPTIYAETASFTLNYAVNKGNSIDGAIGYKFSPSLGVEFGGSYTTRNVDESTSGSIPHPLWMGVLREAGATGSGLKISAIDLYANLVFTLQTKMGGLAVFGDLYGGPCFMLATGTLTTALSPAETTYPYTECGLTQTTGSLTSKVFGFDAGANVGICLTDSIAFYVGARYVSGTAKFKPDSDIPELAVTLGGFKAGAGIKLMF